jgi:ketosteroid isomerase-like protein
MDAVTDVVVRFLEAFDRADMAGMRVCLADDLAAGITNASGGSSAVTGADHFMASIEAMDLPSADFNVTMTQAPVVVDSDRVLVMVEVHAARHGRTLHNYAAHLLRVHDGVITELTMVEAKPAESDAFWS